MTRFVCGRWTPNGPCTGEFEPPAACARCATEKALKGDLEDRRRDRVNAVRDARFGSTAPVVDKCPDGSHEGPRSLAEDCLAAMDPTSGSLLRVRDCRHVHPGDLPPLPLERHLLPWKRRQRARWAEIKAGALERREDAARTMVDWPPRTPMTEPSIANEWFTGDVFSVPSNAGISVSTTRPLTRAVTSAKNWRRDAEDFAGGAEARRAWWQHDGRGPDSGASLIRNAAAELFPNAAPQRDGDAPPSPSEHDEMVGYLRETVYPRTQKYLSTWGITSLTLHRGLHIPNASDVLDPQHPVGAILRIAIQNQRISASRIADRLGGTVDGDLDGPPLASTVDGWATTARLATSWAGNKTSGLRCMMTAEVPAWAILTWGRLAFGDVNDYDDEVVVLGGTGVVRWHVDGQLSEERFAALTA